MVLEKNKMGNSSTYKIIQLPKDKYFDYAAGIIDLNRDLNVIYVYCEHFFTLTQQRDDKILSFKIHTKPPKTVNIRNFPGVYWLR